MSKDHDMLWFKRTTFNLIINYQYPMRQCGLSVMPKDTTAELNEAGLEAAT